MKAPDIVTVLGGGGILAIIASVVLGWPIAPLAEWGQPLPQLFSVVFGFVGAASARYFPRKIAPLSDVITLLLVSAVLCAIGAAYYQYFYYNPSMSDGRTHYAIMSVISFFFMFYFMLGYCLYLIVRSLAPEKLSPPKTKANPKGGNGKSRKNKGEKTGAAKDQTGEDQSGEEPREPARPT